MTDNERFNHLLTEMYGGLMYDSIAEYRQLIRFLTDHLLRDPQNYHALNNRAQAHAELGHRQAARRDFDAAARLAGNDPLPLMNRGRFLDTTEDFIGAIQDFTRALQLSPRNVSAWRCRAYSHWKIGDLASAQADFKRAVELEPDFEATREALAAVIISCKPNVRAESPEFQHDVRQPASAFRPSHPIGILWN